MTTDHRRDDGETAQQHRDDGRYQGQGWYLENQARSVLLNSGYWPHTRVRVWKQEVDILAARDKELPTPPENLPPRCPQRVAVSCIDWFCKERITPSRLWRIIAIALTTRAKPVLVHNQLTQLTDPAQEIAQHWRVRLVTDKDLDQGTILPVPEASNDDRNPIWPSPLDEDVETSYMRSPDYSLPDSAFRRDELQTE